MSRTALRPRSRARSVTAAVALCLQAGLLPACGGGVGRETTLISVAASFAPAMAELTEEFSQRRDDCVFEINTGASAMLAVQLEQGAPVELLVSASMHEFIRLAELDLLDETRPARAIAGNRLVIVTPPGVAPPGTVHQLTDPRFDRIALADPRSAPLGRYTRQVLLSSGLLQELDPRLVLGGDARRVIEYVARGEAAAGIVYLTDAARYGGRVIRGPEIPGEHHDPIHYGAALTRHARGSCAVELLAFLSSESGREIIEASGFRAPR